MKWLRKFLRKLSYVDGVARVHCDGVNHTWVRDGDSLMYVKCLGCSASAVYTGRMDGLAQFPPNGGRS